MIWNQCTTDLTDANEYRCAYAAIFWSVEIFSLRQSNNQRRELSIAFAKIGGYKIDCHIVADDKIDLRPKKRNMRPGLG